MPTLVLVGVITLAVGFGLTLWMVPQWQTPTELTAPQARANFENEARRTIAQILLGGLVLAGLYFTWRRVRAADQTVEVSREQQITERFTRAVEQLGSDNLAIRLGGIYALERIARDSPKDHWQVIEVLTAYVRENARWEGERGWYGVPVSDDTDDHRVPTDVQAILTVLGRRNATYDPPGQKVDLSHIDLRKADFRRLHLKEVNLENTNLHYANFEYSHLEGAWLRCANLCSARFRDAQLGNIMLTYANAQECNFYGAHLEKAHLYDTDLANAILMNAHLNGASLHAAKLQGARLENANLEGASLVKANLSGVIGLTQEQIDSAIIDETTILPDYLRKE